MIFISPPVSLSFPPIVRSFRGRKFFRPFLHSPLPFCVSTWTRARMTCLYLFFLIFCVPYPLYFVDSGSPLRGSQPSIPYAKRKYFEFGFFPSLPFFPPTPVMAPHERAPSPLSRKISFPFFFPFLSLILFFRRHFSPKIRRYSVFLFRWLSRFPFSLFFLLVEPWDGKPLPPFESRISLPSSKLCCCIFFLLGARPMLLLPRTHFPLTSYFGRLFFAPPERCPFGSTDLLALLSTPLFFYTPPPLLAPFITFFFNRQVVYWSITGFGCRKRIPPLPRPFNDFLFLFLSYFPRRFTGNCSIKY